MSEEEKNAKESSNINIKVDLSDEAIKSILADDNDADDDYLYDLGEKDIKRRLVLAYIVKNLFSLLFLGSVVIFPYEIMFDHSFGFSKAFLLVFWGATCLLFGSGVAKMQNRMRRRLRELKSAESPKAS